MKQIKINYLLLLTLVIGMIVSPTSLYAEPKNDIRGPNNPFYQIKAEYDEKHHRVSGKINLSFTQNLSYELKQLAFHL
ncbi:hypothetical protein SAMN05444392_10369 [Seinonella peptonophila]|uniref:Uncharacterized protein n=1 Tax=Seinonella peptonophila TaxID=112248 RepID=A0A1M4W732_9BACL|nr:hypothetical protein [Seinonella peptonophila]SHE77026.1 hypothetical protein SAMN05444392_10369 [Seinonella peptonophila]